METPDSAPGYYIWGIDNAAYGPVELPALVNWIKEERVIADSWIFSDRDNGWYRACEISELKIFYKSKRAVPLDEGEELDPTTDIKPGALRRIKALAELTDEQLATLLKHVEVVRVRPFTHLVHRGGPGDSMFGVLEGELRSCLVLDGKECPVATLEPGSIFGEISLFDRGPHAADVISNQEAVLVKISAQAIKQLSSEAPEAAFALLNGLIKAIAGRVRTLTKRYETSMQLGQRAKSLQPPMALTGAV